MKLLKRKDTYIDKLRFTYNKLCFERLRLNIGCQGCPFIKHLNRAGYDDCSFETYLKHKGL